MRDGKMIDCAIVLAPDAAMANAIGDHIAEQPEFNSINHTEDEPLIDAPISVSMEIKRTGEGWQHARVQCAVWATAQYSRLKALVKHVRETQRHDDMMEEAAEPLKSPQQPQQPYQPHQPHQLHQQQQQQYEPCWPQLEHHIGNMALSPAADTDASASTPASTAKAAASLSSAVASQAQSSATGISAQDASSSRGRCDDAPMIPFLPLIIVQGHDWHFLAASLSPTGTVRCS